MLILLAQAAAEPPPSGYTSAADLALKHAESHPDVFFPLVAALIPLAVIGGLALLYVKWHLPAQREERKLDRESLAKVLGDKDVIAATDMAQTRELAKTQQQALITQIGDEVRRSTGEILKLADRSERHGDLLSRVAAKVGVGLLIALALFSSGCLAKLAAQQTLAQRVHAATVQCTALPATIGDKPNPAKALLCSNALLCQTAAASAATALQDAQKATAAGTTDVAAEARSAGLGVLANVACKRGGW